MFATTNSGDYLRNWTRQAGPFCLCLLGFLLLFCRPFPCSAAPEPPLSQPAPAAAQAREIFEKYRLRARSDSASFEEVWQFARAAFDWAEFASDKTEREQVALEGITASRRAIRENPESAAGHYYLAMNLGQLARTKTLGALRLVPQMEQSFRTARALDPLFDYAGPDRNLGMLFRDAPGWPTSIGSRSKSRDFLLKAVVLAPDYPENQLNLIESHVKWGEKKNARQQLQSLDKIWNKARETFSGDRWKTDWQAWEQRRKALREQLLP